jgi:hypothetical protein
MYRCTGTCTYTYTYTFEDRERLIAAVAKEDNSPINKDMLIKKHYKAFAKFTKQIDKINLTHKRFRVQQ